jgi:hypothetical protein
MISIVSSIVPYEWPDFNMCFAYPEVSLLYFIALMCSLNLTLNMGIWLDGSLGVEPRSVGIALVDGV